jgi:hypothetical protein
MFWNSSINQNDKTGLAWAVRLCPASMKKPLGRGRAAFFDGYKKSGLEVASTANQAHQDDDDCDHQQDMDEAADGIGRNQAKHP